MATITVRDLDDEVRSRPRGRAAEMVSVPPRNSCPAPRGIASDPSS
ncbi:hypothetical protein [Actinomycetospora soli]|nr:hypothetical protein [Actinomycetospora soli]MCD2190366.1 hypothetical protein [Actinomycetospora soli]